MHVNNAMLQLSGICNFRCRMCGHSANNNGMMTDEVFKRIIDDCMECGIHTLIFAGAWGEPTLHPDWQRYLKESIALGFNTILSTNASRLDNKAINFLAISGLKSLQVSFSGFDKKSYESTYIGGKYEVIRKVLKNCKQHFLKISNPPDILINGVAEHAKTESFVDKTYQFLYNLGYSDTEINIVRPCNFGGKLAQKDIIKGDFGIKRTTKESLDMCTVLKDVVGVYWDGKVTACACLDNDGKMLMGNIFITSINDMRKSDYFSKIVECFKIKDLSSLEMCSKCDVPYGSERNVKALPSWLKESIV